MSRVQTSDDKYWQGREENGGKVKFHSHFGKHWQFLHIKHRVTYDLEIPFLGILKK
jgi:hypothetical protein